MLATWGCATFPKPTLDLQFAGATSLDSRITFTRGSQATLFNSAGTLVYAKHNLLLQSEDFATTWIATSATVTTNTIVAPDGALTGDKYSVASGVSSSSSSVRQDISKAASATTYTWSLFAKKGEVDTLRLIPRDGATSANNVDARFNLTTGAVISVVAAGTFTNASGAIQSVGNGWYRCSLTFTSGTETSIRNQIFQLNNNAAFTGNGTDGLFLWGAQLNLSNMEGGVTSSLDTYYPTTTAAYYGPRFDYDPSTLAAQGLLIEEARTNSIRNNTMQGAVAGTPGTLPTNWVQSALGTLTQQIVGTGTENGISYVDIRYSGTTANTLISLQFDSNTQAAAATGQSWTSSFWIKQAGGSQTNITSISNRIRQIDAGGTAVATGTQVIALNTTFSRNTFSGTLTNASTAFVASQIAIAFASGVAIDITLRIGLPQLEQGAFATSVIPTTTTALTRNADVASMTGTNFSSWYNAVEGTFVSEAEFTNTVSFNTVYDVNNGTTSNRIRTVQWNDGSNRRLSVSDGNVTQASITGTGGVGVFRFAAAYKENDFAACQNGGAVGTDTSGTVPSVNQMGIGCYGPVSPTFFLNGSVRRISYYPTRLPNTTLQALTA